MKLIRFAQSGKIALGAMIDDKTVADLSAVMGNSMAAFLGRGAEGLSAAQAALATASPIALPEVKLLAPIADPPKILCIGQNYKDHCEEQNQPLPERAILFAKFTTSLNDPGGAIRIPRVVLQADYEAELAVVIGGKGGGFEIPESEAMEHVAGYFCANDVSGRDIQQHPAEKQWIKGKAIDSFFPIGPALVTADEIDDPHDLDISLTLNGETRQSSNTSNLIFKIPYLISHLSRTITLQPGDIISTGTPGGVGIYSNPPVVLKSGDTVSVTIEKLGTLTNTVA